MGFRNSSGTVFVWAGRAGFGFRLWRVEVQVYFYGKDGGQ